MLFWFPTNLFTGWFVRITLHADLNLAVSPMFTFLLLRVAFDLLAVIDICTPHPGFVMTPTDIAQ